MATVTAPARPRSAPLTEALERHGTGVLIGAVVAIFAIRLLGELPQDVSVDTWLALAAGRLVSQHGVPHQDTLTLITLHHRWIDQQWLSQLISYALYRLGGLNLLGIVNVALIVGSSAAALAAARRRGASLAAVLIAIPPCVALVAAQREVRTQELALPLFCACALLLAADARAPSRRVFWVLPLLALWANLHGTVTLGLVLVVLHCALQAWRCRRTPRALLRPAGLAAGALAAMLATPYGLSIVGYYRATMGSDTLRHYVSEWRPVTSSPALTAALAVLVALAAWSFWRAPRRTSAFEKLALLVLAAGCAQVMRNALFVGLFALYVVPASLGPLRVGAPARTTGNELSARTRAIVNGGIGGLAAAALIAVIAAAAARPADVLLYAHESLGMVAAVERITTADRSLHVFADDRSADFLLWRDPALDGRLEFDVRYELLTAAQLARLQDVTALRGADWMAGARGDRLIVLDRAHHRQAAAAFARAAGSRVLFEDAREIVVLRSARAAGA